MLKATVTPNRANIELAIPESYIGKPLEVLVYTVEEIQAEPTTAKLADPKKPSDFKGIISEELADEYLIYLKKSREEWQQRIL